MEMALKQGHPIPEAIRNHEELPLGLLFYMEAFAVLCDSRPAAHMAIPYSEKLAYCNAEGVRGEERDDFIYLLTRMDLEYIKYYQDKADAKRKAEEARLKKPKPTRKRN